MAYVLKNIPVETHPNLLIGFNKADDAGVYRINETQALVQTVDFFPPIVDDPYRFGQIAAANALSDIYAMGGKPLTALNIVGFPAGMPPYLLTEILRGGGEKVNEAGAVVVGGHSIKDKELKYGIACTGIIDIDKIIANDKAVPDDILILTKPLGTGAITTAIKQKKASADDARRVTEIMAGLNRVASELMVKHGAHAATDITGFGLLGHAFEVADASGVSLEIDFDKLPVIENAVKYVADGAVPGGADANREYMESRVDITASIDTAHAGILYDPQTSGGLLIALPADAANAYIKEAGETGIMAREIGKVLTKRQPAIIVI